MVELVYPELSYRLTGVLFEVHTRLGGQFEEKYYHRAVEQLLQGREINYNKELKADILFEGGKIGRYYLEFLIEDKIILELKTVSILLSIHFQQIRSYLKVKNLRLGTLANFRGEKLTYRRVLNPIISKTSFKE